MLVWLRTATSRKLASMVSVFYEKLKLLVNVLLPRLIVEKLNVEHRSQQA
jgi:hypothetical protein